MQNETAVETMSLPNSRRKRIIRFVAVALNTIVALLLLWVSYSFFVYENDVGISVGIFTIALLVLLLPFLHLLQGLMPNAKAVLMLVLYATASLLFLDGIMRHIVDDEASQEMAKTPAVVDQNQPAADTATTATTDQTADGRDAGLKIFPTDATKVLDSYGDARPLFYLSYTEGSETRSLYLLNLDRNDADIKILESIGDTPILGRGARPDQLLIKKDNTLFELDARTNALRQLLTVADTQLLMHAAYSPDHTLLAYTIAPTGSEGWQEKTVELWVRDLQADTSRKIMEKGAGLYQGLGIQGWAADGSYLIASAVGGDGGYVYGEIYHVDMRSLTVVDIAPANDALRQEFVLGELSPDGSTYAYDRCMDPNDDDPHTCRTGEEVVLYDIQKKTTTSVYKHPAQPEYLDDPYTNPIHEIFWDGNNALFVTSDQAISRVLVNGRGEPQVVLSADAVKEWGNDLPEVQTISSDHIVVWNVGVQHLYTIASQKLEDLKLPSTASNWVH